MSPCSCYKLALLDYLLAESPRLSLTVERMNESIPLLQHWHKRLLAREARFWHHYQ